MIAITASRLSRRSGGERPASHQVWSIVVVEQLTETMPKTRAKATRFAFQPSAG